MKRVETDDAKAATTSAPLAARSQRPLDCLILEDHTLFGQLLAGMLRSLPGIGDVTLATTVASGIATAAAQKLDLVILDLMLPDGHGLQVLQTVVAQRPDVACIILSSKADESVFSADYAKNILALIDKTAAFESLRLEVEAIVRSRLGGLSAAAGVDPERVLRPRELEVFEQIGKGLSTRAIARNLGITMHTVNTHRKAIVAKLGVVGAELVRMATVHNQTLPLPDRAPSRRR
jgi:DNA-binding NarL/FixJ family response regulator